MQGQQVVAEPTVSNVALPWWIPKWMGERERAALILAIGVVLGTVIFSITYYNASWIR